MRKGTDFYDFTNNNNNNKKTQIITKTQQNQTNHILVANREPNSLPDKVYRLYWLL